MTRKVIQISESWMGGYGGAWNLTALCDDGTMWILHNVNEKWSQVPNVPQEIEEEKILQHTTEPCGTGQKPQIFESKTSA